MYGEILRETPVLLSLNPKVSTGGVGVLLRVGVGLVGFIVIGEVYLPFERSFDLLRWCFYATFVCWLLSTYYLPSTMLLLVSQCLRVQL